MTTLGYEPLHKLSAADSVEFFDCAHPALNQFLQRYTEWEFEPSPTDPFHLFLILKDLKAIVEKN